MPWITTKISIFIKNYLLTKYIKLEDVTLKYKAQIKCKQYKNLLFTLMGKKKYLFYKLFPKQLKWLKKYIKTYKEYCYIAPSNILSNGRPV